MARVESSGAYTGDRAAALSGVPASTVHYWAREDILQPSVVSSGRGKLWSFADLMALRIIYWLRRPPGATSVGPDKDIPATSMAAVRRALSMLGSPEEPIWSPATGARVLVDRTGALFVSQGDGLARDDGQVVMGEVLDVIRPFESAEGLHGPDLLRPRPRLAIVPGKLSGSPHVAGTRLETQALWALSSSGVDDEAILSLYPFIDRGELDDALSLERQLDQNLRLARAA